jgi:hypothetical protein
MPIGWGFPGNARKCHYFNGSSFSLCGKWGFFFGRTEPDTGLAGPDDCAACTKEIERLGLRTPAAPNVPDHPTVE